jgi:hypothetical protein
MTVSWAVASLRGDRIQSPVFPTSGSYNPGSGSAPTSIYRGELVCFAVTRDGTAQIAFNHLTGTATVTNSSSYVSEASVEADVTTSQAFRYNARSFIARSAAGLPERNYVRQGTPGRLLLTGGGAGTYHAYPLYNIANFTPNVATLGGLSTRGDV